MSHASGFEKDLRVQSWVALKDEKKNKFENDLFAMEQDDVELKFGRSGTHYASTPKACAVDTPFSPAKVKVFKPPGKSESDDLTQEKTRIYVFDSLSHKHPQVFKVLREFETI